MRPVLPFVLAFGLGGHGYDPNGKHFPLALQTRLSLIKEAVAILAGIVVVALTLVGSTFSTNLSDIFTNLTTKVRSAAGA